MKIQSPADAARLIKTQRLQSELTQHDVAEAIGVTRQSYARIEQAHGGASFATYLKIFAFLGIGLDGKPSSLERADGVELKRDTAHAMVPMAVLQSLGQEAARSARESLRASGAIGRSLDQVVESMRTMAPVVDLTGIAQSMHPLVRTLESRESSMASEVVPGARELPHEPQDAQGGSEK